MVSGVSGVGKVLWLAVLELYVVVRNSGVVISVGVVCGVTT